MARWNWTGRLASFACAATLAAAPMASAQPQPSAEEPEQGRGSDERNMETQRERERERMQPSRPEGGTPSEPGAVGSGDTERGDPMPDPVDEGMGTDTGGTGGADDATRGSGGMGSGGAGAGGAGTGGAGSGTGGAGSGAGGSGGAP